ncbi:phage major capsid protein [Facklamia sp. 7083-14-GEN3]|uniref:phage major capsid protein n=1 Tax=Facklamia sp. 7083-14-GEN3 TaxID=2973478 RepID=UPI00215BFCDE|nr:phage major capsid protein [Facklamia sp. 7083-14-GEN3]MCR8969279.1 phage major capsid protein [Facklamia sp. 7083-14-GEN3]
MATLTKSTLFNEQVVNDLISKVKGESVLAKLSQQDAISFDGNKYFTFEFENEIDIVAESGSKSHGGIKVEPITVVPLKVEYGARVSDEFLIADEERQLELLQKFNEGYAKKLAKGLDIMAFSGTNPRTGSKSDIIGANNFADKVTQSVTFEAGTIDDVIEEATQLVTGADGEISGAALSSLTGASLAKIENGVGVKLYPEFKFGGNPGSLGSLPVQVSKNVTINSKLEGVVGDFRQMFKYGIAKEIPLQVIPYGDPDNSGKDLAGHNEVYLRAETFIGWGILDANSFAKIVEAGE